MERERHAPSLVPASDELAVGPDGRAVEVVAELAGRADPTALSRALTPIVAVSAAGSGAVAVAATPSRLASPSFGDARTAARDRRTGLYVRAVKPALDRLLALVLLLVLAPLLAVLAVTVRLGVGRGVIFRQTRIGLGGEPFTIYKFRTMRPDRRRSAAPFEGPDRRRTHKHAQDPRLTRVGRVLRAWSLDELPQLWNVLRGDMSLVGPRPELPQIVARYEPWQHERHRVKPGLTGLWQVSLRGDGHMHEHVAADIDYVDSVRLLTDARILLLTIPAVLGFRRGH